MMKGRFLTVTATMNGTTSSAAFVLPFFLSLFLRI